MCNCGGVLKGGGCCGCTNCPEGPPGANGVDGLTAYEIWLGEGNEGSEQDFLDSLVGPQGPAGNDGADGLNGPKENFYQEVIASAFVSTVDYDFAAGYGSLTYTNTSGAAKNYVVHVSFEPRVHQDTLYSFKNYVSGAIIKTVAAVDTVEYEHNASIQYGMSLYNSLGSQVNLTSSEKIQGDAGNDIFVRFTDAILFNRKVAFFKSLTLNDGESVSLKFKSGDVSVLANNEINKAQIFVLEID